MSIQPCPQHIAACLAEGRSWPLLHFEHLLMPAGNSVPSLKPAKPISAKTQYSQFSMLAESVESAASNFFFPKSIEQLSREVCFILQRAVKACDRPCLWGWVLYLHSLCSALRRSRKPERLNALLRQGDRRNKNKQVYR